MEIAKNASPPCLFYEASPVAIALLEWFPWVKTMAGEVIEL